MALRVTIIFGLSIFVITVPRPSFPQNQWQLSNRFQIGAEHDDNIFESSARPTAAYSGRLLFSSRADRVWQRTQLLFAYSGGLQTYNAHADENKLTNEANAEARWNVNRWCQIRGSLNGTIKIYFNGPNDFGTTQSALNVVLQLPRRWGLRLTTSSSRLDYAESDGFDYLGRSFGATVRRPFADWLVAEGGVEHARLDYLRFAYDYAQNGFWFSTGKKQRDTQTGAVARVIIGRKFFVNLSGEWHRNSSNSLGYDFERLRLSLIAAIRLAPRWLLRVAALRQQKKYLEALPPILPIELDTERNESNFIVADVSYDLSPQLGWLLRAAYYDNEAAIRGLFYQKAVFFSGMEYRF
jgi:hypothetical protein